MAITILKRPFAYCFSGNTVYYQLYSALAAGDLSVYFEIRVMYRHLDEVAFTALWPIPYSPVVGYAEIDIRELLDSVLEYELPKFSGDETTVWPVTKQTAQFYIEYREITTQSANPSWDSSETSFDCFVVKGGLSYFRHRGNNFWLNYFGSLTADPIPFLTWQKSGRFASLSERMYLAFLNDTTIASGDIRVQVKAFFADGTTTTILTAMPAAKGIIYLIPSGAEQWGLPLIDVNKTVAKWHVQLWNYEDEGNPAFITDPFVYEVDNIHDYNDHTLSYRNSLGGLDSRRIKGVISKTVGYSFNEIEKTVSPNYYDKHFIAPQSAITNKKEKVTWKGDVGPVDKETQDRLRDMNLSDDTWWDVDKKWWPVKIITTELAPLNSSEDSKWHMPIEFTLGDAGQYHYTPAGVDLGNGVFISNVCLAFFSGVTVAVDNTGATAVATINMTENDPDEASTQMRWRLYNGATESFTEWTTVSTGQLVISGLAKEYFYQVEMQPVCGNGIFGRLQYVSFDTATTAPEISPEPPAPGASISTFQNNANQTYSYYILKNDPDGTSQQYIMAGYISALSTISQPTDDFANKTVKVYTVGYVASMGRLEANGNLYYGTINGNEITFNNVYVTGGFNLIVY